MVLLGLWTFITIHSHRRSGPGLVRHQRCGGDRAEQARLGPGLWGHPQAPVLWWGARAQHLHATATRPIPRGDPEEAGGCRRTTEGAGISFIRVKSAWSKRRTLPLLQNNELTFCEFLSSRFFPSRLKLPCNVMVSALCPPLVPGGWTAEAPRRKEGARAWGDPEGLWGEQQLHQERQGETGAEDGGHQGKPGGTAGCHVGEAAGKGQRDWTKTTTVWEIFHFRSNI